jgi:hypothetical protein
MQSLQIEQQTRIVAAVMMGLWDSHVSMSEPMYVALVASRYHTSTHMHAVFIVRSDSALIAVALPVLGSYHSSRVTFQVTFPVYSPLNRN